MQSPQPIAKSMYQRYSRPKIGSFLIFVFLVVSLPTGLLAKKSPALITKTYSLSSNPFSSVNPSNSNGVPEPAKGVKILPTNGVNAISYDVRDFFRLQGVPLSEGSQALFFLDNHVLVVHATMENIELVETLMTMDDAQTLITNISCEFVVGTFSLPANQEIHLPLPYVQFQKRADNTWKVINQLSLFSKSGLKVSSMSQQKVKEDEPFKTDLAETEIKAEVEIVIQPDGNTLTNVFTFSFNGSVLKDSPRSEIALSATKSSWNGYPAVIYLSKVGNAVQNGSTTNHDHYLAVILKMSLCNGGGWKVKTSY